ncbi:transcriptional regulator, BadM/Rrf2 family [Cupriavidus sp. YR651]|uniref:RrF2 family transcriptional regulator n=1 Tax=Cupriavidus sp. YR651 TaxID=1855315 RepID=UPI0008925B27|nr:Rrf2 family transcriptional regulator [Cupriavidus sp. YR651]SDC54728.1 transcriptional regulator, BadM/Rrf2 family [Cupriavidus sp. YR651]
MQLTAYTEYGLHALVYLARRQGEAPTARQIAEAIGLPLNHLVKILHRLRQAGFLDTTRGRNGGTRLARPADSIRVGEVVRTLEHPHVLADCLHGDGRCAMEASTQCGEALKSALGAYRAVLDGYSIADLAR